MYYALYFHDLSFQKYELVQRLSFKCQSCLSNFVGRHSSCFSKNNIPVRHIESFWFLDSLSVNFVLYLVYTGTCAFRLKILISIISVIDYANFKIRITRQMKNENLKDAIASSIALYKQIIFVVLIYWVLDAITLWQ